MLEILRNLLTPPVYPEDDEKTRVAGLLNSILFTIIVFTTVLVLPGLLITTNPVNRLPLFLVIAPSVLVNVVAYVILHRGRVQLASNIFLINISIGVFGAFAVSDLSGASSYLSISILFALTTLLLNPGAILRLLALTLLITLFATVSQTSGWITPIIFATTNPFGNWFSNSVIFILAGTGLFFASQSLRHALNAARASKENLQTSNQELNELRRALEQRVAERTADLEKRASQLEAIANTARSAASARSLEDLLSAFTKDISARFGFYHIGIFLLDANKEFAVLRASNSEGGQNLLARGHRLRVGEQGIVGYTSYSGNPRIALDVGADAVFFNNPDLPATRSEIALPLKFGQEIIGVLDIQSTEANAFSREDVEIFSTLAYQVSVAIQNARSLDQAQRALQEAEIASSQLTGNAWKGYIEKISTRGYRYDGIKPEPLRKSSVEDKNTVSIPVQLRGQTIGRLKLRASSPTHTWSDDELAIIESTAGRVALAIDSARLLEEAQKRATRESFLSEIGTKLGTSFQLDSILRDTVEELGQTLKGSTVSFQLVNPTAPSFEAGTNDTSARQEQSE